MTDMIDDKLLYLYMPQAEQIMLEQYPPMDEPEHSFSKRFNHRLS